MVQLSFIQTQLSDSGKRLIVITIVVFIERKVKDNSAFSTRTRCYKNIAIKMLVLNTANFWQDRYTIGYQNCTGAVHFWQGRYTFGDQKCTGAVVSSPDPDSQQLRVDYITATWKVATFHVAVM